MTWTLWGLAVQTVAGLLGAHAIAGAAREYRFGFVGHSLAGIVGGALSGAFLQGAAVTIVTGNGSQNLLTVPQMAVAHVLTGAVAGGILTLAIGFFLAERSGRTPGS
ncbi:hypothetical protein JQ615_25305 [Bradyrhizobium jicamae]|uniref:Ammonium transporter AmtB-like domain-containing protein n=1 Tax=Bradyrhizobium jicamae TaxID=280332 RepID=A0ABS5FPH8_9BRAD|nr:hypothetical protein [Bradyrhizobium jicamae]MBR0798711.1 hypothetical protein [Bradyrhizobium jicamae]